MFGFKIMLVNVCAPCNHNTRRQPTLHPHVHRAAAELARQHCQGRQVSRKGSHGWKQADSLTVHFPVHQ